MAVAVAVEVAVRVAVAVAVAVGFSSPGEADEPPPARTIATMGCEDDER
nr:hypothetical protein [Tepidiforma sp.]